MAGKFSDSVHLLEVEFVSERKSKVVFVDAVRFGDVLKVLVEDEGLTSVVAVYTSKYKISPFVGVVLPTCVERDHSLLTAAFHLALNHYSFPLVQFISV